MASSKVFSFSDPFPYQATIRAVDAELYPTTKGQFQAELTQINFDRLWMQRSHERLPAIYSTKIRPGRTIIGFLADADQPSVQNCGRDVSPQEILVLGGEGMHHRTRGDCGFGSMSLPADYFDAAFKAVAGHEFSVDKFKRIVRPSPDLMVRLTKLHRTVAKWPRLRLTFFSCRRCPGH